MVGRKRGLAPAFSAFDFWFRNMGNGDGEGEIDIWDAKAVLRLCDVEYSMGTFVR